MKARYYVIAVVLFIAGAALGWRGRELFLPPAGQIHPVDPAKPTPGKIVETITGTLHGSRKLHKTSQSISPPPPTNSSPDTQIEQTNPGVGDDGLPPGVYPVPIFGEVTASYSGPGGTVEDTRTFSGMAIVAWDGENLSVDAEIEGTFAWTYSAPAKLNHLGWESGGGMYYRRDVPLGFLTAWGRIDAGGNVAGGFEYQF